MQAKSRALQAPQVIVRAIERSTAVNSYPAQEHIGVLGGDRHGLSARTIEVQSVGALNDEHGGSANKATDKQAIHALSIYGDER